MGGGGGGIVYETWITTPSSYRCPHIDIITMDTPHCQHTHNDVMVIVSIQSNYSLGFN